MTGQFVLTAAPNDSLEIVLFGNAERNYIVSNRGPAVIEVEWDPIAAKVQTRLLRPHCSLATTIQSGGFIKVSLKSGGTYALGSFSDEG